MRIEGIGVSYGITRGRIKTIENPNIELTEKAISQEKASDLMETFYSSRENALDKVRALFRQGSELLKASENEIFQAYELIIQDPLLEQFIGEEIGHGAASLAEAIEGAFSKLKEILSTTADELTMARETDLNDICRLLIECSGPNKKANEKTDNEDENSAQILIAEDLAPSQIIRLYNENLKGIVLKAGSKMSHSSILAESLGIPMLVKANLPGERKELDGLPAILDGEKGILLVEPSDREEMQYGMALKSNDKDHIVEIQRKKDMEIRNGLGEKVHFLANISGKGKPEMLEESGAEGVGLFRTEFLYIGREEEPSEEEQFQIYKELAQNVAGPVVIRTADIGSDKKLSYIKTETEENPAMGIRGIRFSRKYPEIFRRQIDAILRAAVYGDIKIMLPFISNAKEVSWAKKIIEEEEQSLKEKGIVFREPQLGIMIETPAAALISEELAREVSFFSIGTNDLTQYTLAMDRQNEELSASYKADHPAIFSLIKMTVENGHRHGCRVGICGEMAGEPKFTKQLLTLGVDELSMNSGRIKLVKQAALD